MDDFDWTLSNEAALQAASELRTILSQRRHLLTPREQQNLSAAVRALTDAVTVHIVGR